MEIGKETKQLDMVSIKDKVRYIRECLLRGCNMGKGRRFIRMGLVMRGILLRGGSMGLGC